MKSPRGLFVAFMRHVREADIRAVTAESMCYALLCYRPKTGSVCPSDGVFFPFVSERKRNQKEREFKGCALKNPPHCTDLLCSIKSAMFPVFAITGRASRDEIVRSGKRKNCGCDHRSRLRRSYNFMTNRQYSMSVCNLETG